MKEICKQAIEHFGAEKQIDMCIEEMAELTQALCKHKRGLMHNVEEEIADVEIMLEQIKNVFNRGSIDGYRDMKIIRLEKIIKNAE